MQGHESVDWSQRPWKPRDLVMCTKTSASSSKPTDKHMTRNVEFTVIVLCIMYYVQPWAEWQRRSPGSVPSVWVSTLHIRSVSPGRAADWKPGRSPGRESRCHGQLGRCEIDCDIHGTYCTGRWDVGVQGFFLRNTAHLFNIGWFMSNIWRLWAGLGFVLYCSQVCTYIYV